MCGPVPVDCQHADVHGGVIAVAGSTRERNGARRRAGFDNGSQARVIASTIAGASSRIRSGKDRGTRRRACWQRGSSPRAPRLRANVVRDATQAGATAIVTACAYAADHSSTWILRIWNQHVP